MPCNLISSCFFLESPWSRDQVMQGGSTDHIGGPGTIQGCQGTRLYRGGSRDQVIQGSGTIQGVQEPYRGFRHHKRGSRDQVIQGSGTIQGGPGDIQRVQGPYRGVQGP